MIQSSAEAFWLEWLWRAYFWYLSQPQVLPSLSASMIVISSRTDASVGNVLMYGRSSGTSDARLGRPGTKEASGVPPGARPCAEICTSVRSSARPWVAGASNVRGLACADVDCPLAAFCVLTVSGCRAPSGAATASARAAVRMPRLVFLIL